MRATFTNINFHRLLNYLNPLMPPNIKDITNRTKKIKNRIFAISTAPPAIPPNPNIAATRAIIKNVTTHLNIVNLTLV